MARKAQTLTDATSSPRPRVAIGPATPAVGEAGARVVRLSRDEPRPPGAPVRALPADAPPASPVAGLAALRIVSIERDGEVERVLLQIGSEVVPATLDPAVHPVVVRTAFERRERIIAQREGDAWVVLGSLRTSPTPGIDPGDEYVIRARRIAVLAEHELSMVSGGASLVLRAFGFVETIAQDITSRASSVHKVIGRVIRLN